jgi:hypothetical protein
MNTTLQDFKLICENEFDWNMIFGAVKQAYSDKGFKSNSDNFLRAKVFELAISCFSQVEYVDEDGVDFILKVLQDTIRIEAKFLKGFFKKNGTCKDVKMKNYRGDVTEVAFNRYKTEDKFDYVMIIDRDAYKVAIAPREVAQKYYVSKGDGVMVSFPVDELTILNLDCNSFTFPESPDMLSDLIRETMINWIKNR